MNKKHTYSLGDVDAARRAQLFQLAWFADPVSKGEGFPHTWSWYTAVCPSVSL
jgi:hypothetical protein